MSAVELIRDQGRQVAALAQAIREVCGDDNQAFVDTLEGECSAVDAARAVVRLINECEANQGSMKLLSELYASRAKTFEMRQERARAALLQFMGDIGAKSLPLPEGTLSVVVGAPQLTGNSEELPDALVKVKREPDRTKIKGELQAGREVPGYALTNAAPRLQIRSR